MKKTASTQSAASIPCPISRHRTPVQTHDELRMRVIYADPSPEAERRLDDVVARIYRFGIQKQIFQEQEVNEGTTSDAQETLCTHPTITPSVSLFTITAQAPSACVQLAVGEPKSGVVREAPHLITQLPHLIAKAGQLNASDSLTVQPWLQIANVQHLKDADSAKYLLSVQESQSWASPASYFPCKHE